jgi:chromosomal replication initiator protein
VDVIDIELTALWGRVIDAVALDAPQHRAFLTLTKPLGLIPGNGVTNLLVAAPNAFAKDVLETRLRSVLGEVLSRELNERANIAVTIDETLEVANSPTAPEVEIEITAPKSGTGREDNSNVSIAASKSSEQSQLNPRYIFETLQVNDLINLID